MMLGLAGGFRVSANRAEAIQYRKLVCAECGGRIKPMHITSNKRRDGTYPRRYVCYWKRTSQQDLDEYGHHRCRLPVIEADLLEESVLLALLYRLGLGGRVKTSKGITRIDPKIYALFDPLRYDQQEAELQISGSTIEKELTRKKRSRDRMYRMLEEPDFDQNEVAQRLHQNQGEILDLESKLELVKDKIARVKAARESDSMLKSFLLSKRAAVENLNRVIYGLPAKEKKDLIKALVEGDIEIGDGEGDGEKWQIVRMPLVFKPAGFKGLLVD